MDYDYTSDDKLIQEALESEESTYSARPHSHAEIWAHARCIYEIGNLHYDGAGPQVMYCHDHKIVVAY